MEIDYPPYKITDKMLNYVSDIMKKIGEATEFIEFMLKMIDYTIDEMNNSKEMKYKSMLLLSENEIKVLECIKKNVIIGAKDIIEQTQLSDSTVRRILRKSLQDKMIQTTDNNEKSPNKKYKLTE